MPEYRYAKGRIAESLQFIAEEMQEFEKEYSTKTWQEYQKDKKLQKLMDRTVENILTALIEVNGALLSEEGIAGESYSETLKKTGNFFGFSDKEQEDLSKLAIQRNRLAHRYLNFRWQAIKMYTKQRDVLKRLLSAVLERENSKENT
jgi:uncharacterized protein YutE (UPF0331/DUF86 family)